MYKKCIRNVKKKLNKKHRQRLNLLFISPPLHIRMYIFFLTTD